MSLVVTRKSLGFALVGWLLIVVAGAASAAQDFNHGLLWQISKQGHASSHLFGTIHSEDSRVLAQLEQAPGRVLKSAKAVVIETELNAVASAQFAAAMFFTDGQKLRHLLEPEWFQRAVSAAQSRGLGEHQVDTMKPWVLMTLLAMPAPKTGQFLDAVIYQSGMQQGVRVGGLETPQEQIEAMDGLALEDQLSLLRETIEEVDELPKLLEELTQSYLDKDLKRMQELYDEYSERSDRAAEQRLKERILLARNDRMMERMQQWLNSGGSFIAVGALHLPGPNGLLQQLHDQGWKVERIY